METKTWPDRFAGQVAVVTGGADGLGFAIAERLIAEGAIVWLFDRDDARVKAAAGRLGPRAFTCALDITDETVVRAGFEAVVATHDRLDVMVNSAGIEASFNTGFAFDLTGGRAVY